MIELKNVSFAYSDTEAAILEDVSVSIPTGSFVAVVGDNGAGKSTFCKLLNGIIPHFMDGNFRGDILIDGQSIKKHSPAQLAHHVGYVYQDFENQIIRPRVLDDASYGLLNEGQENYLQITMEVLATLDLAHLADEFVWQLSGGQKHLLALAGVIVMSPDTIVLDEPIAQLDPLHAQKIYENLRYLNQELGKTIIVIEHNAEFIGKYCDHVLFLKNRNIGWFLPVDEALQNVEELMQGGVYPPQVTMLAHEMIQRGYSNNKILPTNMEQAIAFMRENEKYLVTPQLEIPKRDEVDEPFIEMSNLMVEYARINEKPKSVMNDLNLTIYQGEKVAIIGNNGAGKSSLMKLLIGLIKPTSGCIKIAQKDIIQMNPEAISDILGYVYQNAENMFIEDSIEKDIAFSLKARGQKDFQQRTEELLEQFDLTALRHRDGRLLSGGQMRRASLAVGISLSPKCLLLDEPTASLDLATRKRITSTLKELSNSIETVLIATHDMQLVAEWASRIVVMHNGEIIGDGSRETIFADTKLLKKAGVQVPEIIELGQHVKRDLGYSLAEFVQRLEMGEVSGRK
ncbi:MAG: ABC transporter ATP-binding protein [Enterococcus sp.]